LQSDWSNANARLCGFTCQRRLSVGRDVGRDVGVTELGRRADDADDDVGAVFSFRLLRR
jgi:hypothetical protein